MKKNIKMAYLGAVLYSLIMGFSFMFVKLIVEIATPIDILAYRFLIAFMFMCIPILFGWVKLNIRLKEIFRFIPLALFYPILFFVFQTLGLLHATSAEGGIIQATAPIFTLILASIFLKEKTTIWQKVFLTLSVFGVIYMFLMQGSSISANHLQSIILLLLSVISLAIYSIMARPLNQTYRTFDLTFSVILLSMISFVTTAFLQHLISGTLPTMIQPLYHPVFWYSIFYLGCFSTVFTVFLSNFALSKLETYKVSVFNNLATLISILAGVIFLNEQATYVHLIGTAMIIVGVLGTNLAGNNKKKLVRTEKKV